MNLHRSMKWIVGMMLAGGVCACVGAQQDAVRFVQPTRQLIKGMADVEVTAPSDTAAVRFYLDGTQTSELTDAYALATKTAPVWHALLSAAWAGPGRGSAMDESPWAAWRLSQEISSKPDGLKRGALSEFGFLLLVLPVFCQRQGSWKLCRRISPAPDAHRARRSSGRKHHCRDCRFSLGYDGRLQPSPPLLLELFWAVSGHLP